MPLSNKSIVKNSLPVAFAYIILGLTFGALFASKGGTTIEALFISVFCFAGAAQFVAIEFYKPDFSALFLFITIFILNIRHIFYGLSFANRWKTGVKVYLFSALTDENFGISNIYKDYNPTDYQWVKIFFLNHAYWIVGCVFGSLVPAAYMQKVVGSDFALVALFVAIFASSMRKRKESISNG